MPQALRLISLLALAAGLSGCLAMSTDDPYPVTDNSPNPAPVAGYRVLCQSEPGLLFHIIDSSHYTACQQVIVPTRRTTVIRAKG